VTDVVGAGFTTAVDTEGGVDGFGELTGAGGDADPAGAVLGEVISMLDAAGFFGGSIGHSVGAVPGEVVGVEDVPVGDEAAGVLAPGNVVFGVVVFVADADGATGRNSFSGGGGAVTGGGAGFVVPRI
jgi:hypothetical protein